MELPFDRNRLDELMAQAGVDLVLATGKHTTKYLLGGYRYHFYAEMEAMGQTRYLNAVGYPRGRPEDAFFVGLPGETPQLDREGIWTPHVRAEAASSVAVATVAADAIESLGLGTGTVAVELPFLPADTYGELARRLPQASLVDGVAVLEGLRAVKSPEELTLLRQASELIVESMLAVIGGAEPGVTTREVAERLRAEEVARGLGFDYCLVATAGGFYRAPSDDRWEPGTSISLDSGGKCRGYLGDLARMAVMGEPTQLMRELLAEVDAVQLAARRPIRPGADGTEIFAAAHAELAGLPHREQTVFEAHGMGLVSHECPHLHPDAPSPLEPGMVISIETTMKNPEVGFVKLEDTVVVTDDGWEAYGDTARGWNVAGAVPAAR
ncbi:MAG: aminopeptidase P family protein [Candidatus Dormibacteraeota bacterium]|nr:aminopeptidase P family protein [Candidatus Dormibacteraeota bacterium]MBO0703755.1 aminopeptidase P family protein [Candidatus Dormibacteraeota bacterium]MBO0759809.1 aminopeptidase P family protein [Candidatus Dormibacteraeota bacterium]